MSVIADFAIPAEQFALGRLLEVRPGVQVRLESMIPTGEAPIPYFWVRSPDVEAVEAALDATPVVEDVQVLDQVGDETLFRVGWSEDVDGVVAAIAEADSVILDGWGHGDDWTFQLRFQEYDDLSAFYRAVVDEGISIDVEGVHDPVESTGSPGMALTEEQREALLIAFEEGYFAVPREITLVELAERLEISDSAVSQRIRRGLTELLSTRLSTG